MYFCDSPLIFARAKWKRDKHTMTRFHQCGHETHRTELVGVDTQDQSAGHLEDQVTMSQRHKLILRVCEMSLQQSLCDAR
jgi:hypothetical protein